MVLLLNINVFYNLISGSPEINNAVVGIMECRCLALMVGKRAEALSRVDGSPNIRATEHATYSADTLNADMSIR